MLRFMASRIATVAVMAVLSTLVIFLIANTVPGDPVLAQLGDVAASDPAFVAVWRHKYGLDLPLWERYFVFLKGVIHGDLGFSWRIRQPVLQLVADSSEVMISSPPSWKAGEEVMSGTYLCSQ